MSGSEEMVVWLDLSAAGYAWWPCRVEDGNYVSFQDECQYSMDRYGMSTGKESKVRAYNHEDLSMMVKKGIRKLRKKKDTSEMYAKAIDEAVQYIRSHIDDGFQLNLESNGSMGHTCSSNTRSERTSVSENVPCELSPHQYVLSGKKRNHQGHILALNNGSYGEVPGRWVGGASCDEDILKGKQRETKRPEVGMSAKAVKESTPVETIRKKRGRKRKRESSTPTSVCLDSSIPGTTEEGVVKKYKTLPLTEPCPQLPCTPVATMPALAASTPVVVIPDCATPLTSSSHFTDAACPLGMDSEDECLSLTSDSDSDSDDDLPTVDLSVKEAVNLHELRPKSVVWAKFGKWPFWPALVSRVYRPSKKRTNVNLYFFGYNEKMNLKVSNKKNVVLFGTKNSQEFMKKGLSSLKSDRDQFEQAVKEARELVREMAEGAYRNLHSPKEVFRKAISNRPKDYVNTNPSLPTYSLSGAESEEESEEEEEEENVSVLCLTTEDISEDEEVEEEEEEPLYSYDQVATEIKSLHPILEDIGTERVSSAFHTMFMGGTKKQRSSLMFGEKFGPLLKGWKDDQITHLIEEKLLVVAKKVGFGFNYSFDVLLPEALVRLISRFDNISYDAALKKFYQ